MKGVATTEKKWRQWIKDNPGADRHQLYYAAGVIDGLRYAVSGKPFSPDWKKTLKLFLNK